MASLVEDPAAWRNPMSAGGRIPVAILMACVVLAFTAPAARAQMMGDSPSNRAGLAPVDPLTAVSTSASLLSGSGALRPGLAFQLYASLAAYRWLEPAMSRSEVRQGPPVARQDAVGSAWWRKRF